MEPAYLKDPIAVHLGVSITITLKRSTNIQKAGIFDLMLLPVTSNSF